MTIYSSLNVKLSNSQLDKLKSATENETEVVCHQIWSAMTRQIFLINYY